jgi:hypothetical protein
MSWEILFLHSNAIFTLVCLKRFVIFLICGDTYVNVVHLVLFLHPVGIVWAIFCSSCCLSLIRMLSGKLLHLAISSMVVHSLSWCSLLCCSWFFLYYFVYIDDARSNTNQVYVSLFCCPPRLSKFLWGGPGRDFLPQQVMRMRGAAKHSVSHHYRVFFRDYPTPRIYH